MSTPPSSPVTSDTLKVRANSIGPQDMFLLDQWGRQLREAFCATPYLVGSVARAERSWRDVDVRISLDDDSWPFCEEAPSRLFAINLAISLWGRRVTALPIDFQFQSASVFSRESGVRNPLIRSECGWALEARALREVKP